MKVVGDSQEVLHDFIADFVAPIPGALRIRTAIVTKKFKETALAMVDSPKKLTTVKEDRIRMEKTEIEGGNRFKDP